MSRIRVVSAFAGAALLAGGTAALAGVVANDDAFRAVPGSTLRIKVRQILANDRATRPSRGLAFVRLFRLAGDLDEGIKSFSFDRRRGIVTIRLARGFVGPAGLGYEIRASGPSAARDRVASARIRIRATPS